MLSFAVGYHKRFKMERSLVELPPVTLPVGYAVQPWRTTLAGDHAAVLAACFAGALDATIFPSLGSAAGCVALLDDISRRSDFVPESTWLLVGPGGPCGSIQALRERLVLAAIQNIGIRPGEQNRGLGRALLVHALHALRQAGFQRAMLEVTASNLPALRLYFALGFRRTKVLYKPIRQPVGDDRSALS